MIIYYCYICLQPFPTGRPVPGKEKNFHSVKRPMRLGLCCILARRDVLRKLYCNLRNGVSFLLLFLTMNTYEYISVVCLLFGLVMHN